VVGVNTLVAGGLGVAVAVERVRRFVAGLAPSPRLGVAVRPVRVRRRGAPVSASTGGLLVLEVARGSAAEGGGVLPGDVLFAAAERPLVEPADLTDALRRAAASGTLVLEVGRGGRLESRLVALSEPDRRQRAA
jgi:S1-C subfamily serine protease